ncbi:helix-turn-helix domain-containing protein [Streptomyces sp. NPDC051569]|uniref:helix-turn-helix domain-containing protein n=1 Tax=Streptomyces sp. NPDC051569 TaxID=3365661 RepID=UPI0037AAAE58
MPQPPKPLEPGRSDRDWFGAELRHWRTRHALTQDELGASVHVSGDLIAKIEKAVRRCTPELAEVLDARLRTGGVLARALVRVMAEADSRTADADNRGVDADSSAGAGRHGDPPERSAAMLDEAGDREIRVPCRTADGRIIFVTMPRRALLRGGLTGAALLAPGGAALTGIGAAACGAYVPDTHPVQHLQQLRRALVECDNLLGSGHVIGTVRDHIALIQRLRADTSGADRRALLQVQAEYAEFCGWLHQDAGDHRAAQYWTDRALDWSHASGGRELVTYVMVRKAHLAGDIGDRAEALDLADAAQVMAPPHGRLQAMSAMYGAHGHALYGDSGACRRAYDMVLNLVSELHDEAGRRGGWLDTTYVQAQRAHSLSALGDHSAAAEGFAQAIRSLPPYYRRDRGVYLSRAAVAHVRAEEPEQAVENGLQALPIAAQTGSARIFNELSVLDAELGRWQTSPEVVEFRAALDSIVTHQA